MSTVLVLSPAVAEEQPCAECHEGDPDPAAFAESVHGAFGCADCHSGAEEFPHADGAGDVDCSICHDQEVAQYKASVHGVSATAGDEDAPACATCHGSVHALLPSSSAESPVGPGHLAETCGKCHADPELVKKHGIPVAKPIEAYSASVHAAASMEGGGGATCSSCHGSHDIQAASDPRSSVFHARVPGTCGQCHGEITATYLRSVHGEAASQGVREAPVCTDCHGEHRILSPEAKDSPVFATNIPKMTCGRCHGDLRLVEKFDMSGTAVAAYDDSYHGLASRSGKVTVANCSSCHGVHDILPSSDPASHIHESRLSETCGSCHPGAGTRFAIGEVHVLPTDKEHAAVYWVRQGYLWLIWMTIGGMVLHNLLDLYRKTRSPLPRSAYQPVVTRERMRTGFRIAHGAMIVSFTLLVWSGFALKYPEAFWAAPLVRWEEVLGFRGWLHRGAAIVMIAAFAFHVVHLAVDRRARACIAGMIPKLHDVTELRERLLWYVGRRPDPPRTPTLGYPEKAEYLALIWGTVVMLITGFLLWFENPALRFFPKWISDVATAIHFYEAILASLAIVVWHFYFVIFDPVVYPMDMGWLTGREHPARALEREERHDDVAGEAGPDTATGEKEVRSAGA